MAKWAEKPWVDEGVTETGALLIRIRRVAKLIETDAVCKSRPNVRARAQEIEALITLLEKRLNE